MVRGKIIQRSTGRADKQSAERFAREYLEPLKRASNERASARVIVAQFRDILAGGEPLPLADVWQLFRKKPTRRQASDKSWRRKQTYWNDFLVFLAEKFPAAHSLNDVSRKMAEHYINGLDTAGKYSKTVNFKNKGRRAASTYQAKYTELSPSTRNLYLQTLTAIFAALADDSGLLENPFAKIPAKIVSAKDKISREAFSPDELRQIGAAAREKPFIYAIFIVGANTGLREGDLATLRWSETDLNRGLIIRQMLKTSKSVRIPILPPLRAYLQGLDRTGEYVLPEHAKMYQSNPTGISWRVRKFLEGLGIETTRKIPGRTKAANIKDVHALRHTFCWLAAVNGVPMPVIQSIVGHVNEKLTQQYAAHATDEMAVKHLAKMPNYLGGLQPEMNEIQVPALPAAGNGKFAEAVRMLEAASGGKKAELVAANARAIALLKGN